MLALNTTQKMKLYFEYFFSKYVDLLIFTRKKLKNN